MEICVRRLFACTALAQVAFERGGRRFRGWVARYSFVFGRWWVLLLFCGFVSGVDGLEGITDISVAVSSPSLLLPSEPSEIVAVLPTTFKR